MTWLWNSDVPPYKKSSPWTIIIAMASEHVYQMKVALSSLDWVAPSLHNSLWTLTYRCLSASDKPQGIFLIFYIFLVFPPLGGFKCNSRWISCKYALLMFNECIDHLWLDNMDNNILKVSLLHVGLSVYIWLVSSSKQITTRRVLKPICSFFQNRQIWRIT